MAVKVCVPMDFGRHLIGSPTHSNLRLNTSEGGEVRASSVILSFNSPVIDHMTTTLHMTSVDMLEFSEAAVQLFVDAAYSGTAEDITRELFRDINKISHVFEMTWLSEKCSVQYKNFVDSVTTSSYEELYYLFEEAAFVFENMKTRNYLVLAIKKIEELRYKQEFMDKYLENADRLSTKKLDMVIELAGSEVNCVVQTLTNQLSEQLKVQGSNLPVSSEYLLDNSNLYLCKQSNRDVFDLLFENLLQLPADKMRWAFELHLKYSKDVAGLVGDASGSSVTTSSVVTRCNTISNLYHNLDMNMTFDELLDWLSTSEQVTSLLMAIEAVWTWNRYRYYILHVYYTVNMSVLSARLTDMIERRGWSLLPSQFSECRLQLLTTNGWEFFNFTPFCSPTQQTCSYVIIDCVDTCTKSLSLLSKEAKLTFHFKHPSVTSCNLPGKCGFILKTVPSEAALWKLKLCTENEDYVNEPVHFHDEIRAESMHVYFVAGTWFHPISWLGWLHSNSAVEQRNSWETKVFFGYGLNNRFKVLYNLIHL